LERHGYEPTVCRVERAGPMATALKEQPWDIVISDYSLPAFSGPAALKLFQESNLDIPFLVVSGTLGEEAAVAMMKAGAHDYILKDNLARLVPAIDRELAAAASRREQRQMREASAHLAALVESSNDAIISQTLDGTILSWNKAAEQIYGYTAQEMIGRSMSVLMFTPHPENELNETLKMIQMGEQVHHFETTRLRKDRSRVDVSVTISPIKSAMGEVVGASVIERDIADRKREEAERLRLIDELTRALAQAKTLRGLLPICASCKKIRDDNGYWKQVEVYIQEHSEAGFTHGICPECTKKLYPDFVAENSASSPELIGAPDATNRQETP
ncbi:MAG: PAS domain S-box protein, partial [Verrucomicrobia bacterium]